MWYPVLYGRIISYVFPTALVVIIEHCTVNCLSSHPIMVLRRICALPNGETMEILKVKLFELYLKKRIILILSYILWILTVE
jgi:hypothetical protein